MCTSAYTYPSCSAARRALTGGRGISATAPTAMLCVSTPVFTYPTNTMVADQLRKFMLLGWSQAGYFLLIWCKDLGYALIIRCLDKCPITKGEAACEWPIQSTVAYTDQGDNDRRAHALPEAPPTGQYQPAQPDSKCH